MASRIEAALTVATEAVQQGITDMAGAVQSPVALLNATAANAAATLAVALVLEDMRRRWARAERAEGFQDRSDGTASPTDELGNLLPRESIDNLIGAATEAMAALGKTHPASKRLAAALAAAGPIGMAVSDQPAPPSAFKG